MGHGFELQESTRKKGQHPATFGSRPEICIQLLDKITHLSRQSFEFGKFVHRVVNLIRDGFGFYFVGLFLVGSRGERAYLYAGSGEVGPVYCQTANPVFLNKPNSIVGKTIVDNTIHIAFDSAEGYTIGLLPAVGSSQRGMLSQVEGRAFNGVTRLSKVMFANPLLPDTRSEMSVPLRTSTEEVIGVLSMLSCLEEDFIYDNAFSFLHLADHIGHVCAKRITDEYWGTE